MHDIMYHLSELYSINGGHPIQLDYPDHPHHILIPTMDFESITSP